MYVWERNWKWTKDYTMHTEKLLDEGKKMSVRLNDLFELSNDVIVTLITIGNNDADVTRLKCNGV